MSDLERGGEFLTSYLSSNHIIRFGPLDPLKPRPDADYHLANAGVYNYVADADVKVRPITADSRVDLLGGSSEYLCYTL